MPVRIVEFIGVAYSDAVVGEGEQFLDQPIVAFFQPLGRQEGDDLFAAGSAVTEIIGSGIQLTACEIMDKYSLKVVEKAIERDISGIEAMLIIEADGAKETVIKDINKILENIIPPTDSFTNVIVILLKLFMFVKH